MVRGGGQKPNTDSDCFPWDYREQQGPMKTHVYDMIQHIHMSVGFFWYTEFQGSYYTLPYTGQTIPSFALGIILLPSPWQKWQQSPKATHCKEHRVLSLADKCSHHSCRVKTCLAGQQRVCTQLPINMS